MFASGCSESFKRALHDSLAADVNPGARSHLAVHRQAKTFEAIELCVIVPLSNEVGIRDKDARRFIVRPEFAHWLPGLHEECFIVSELAQRTNDCIESFPASGGAACSAINDQSIRILGNIRIEIVHQHSHRSFLMPAFAASLAALRRVDNSLSTHDSSSSLSKSPRRIASATRAISFASGRSRVSGGDNLRTIAKARSTPTPLFKGRRCSRPSAAASNSMAAKFSASPTIDRSFNALVIPMET